MDELLRMEKAGEVRQNADGKCLQKVGPLFRSPIKIACFTSPENAVVLLFLDLFRLLWR
jgi:hypothetical protein